jgi:cob(I)alamin adenosyltransferase
MENMFPTLLERDNIKEDVGKWIQFTMNEIDKYKIDLAKCDTSSEIGEESAVLISKKIKNFELRLTKLDNFYLSIGEEKYCKVNYAQKEGLNIRRIYAQGPCIFKLDCDIIFK